MRGKTQRVFFVPATINYLLTLEAETLIDDFLTEEGKARYIIEDDESTQVSRIAAFMQQAPRARRARASIRFSQPVDCFGNAVDDDGVSHDTRGRADRSRCRTSWTGRTRPVRDAARDAQYTRELGEVICAAYKRDTVVMATHLAAAAAFDHLRSRTSGHADLFALLRHTDDVSVPRARSRGGPRHPPGSRARGIEARAGVVLAHGLKRADGAQVLDEALRAFAGYHTHEVLAPRGDRSGPARTPGSSSITRTAWRLTGWPSTQSLHLP